ncbi:hypothetical protein COCVIDRAFT_33687 [Bipolaris victoriae FI3]|uniref:Terpene synthase n=1 Tax=Bipolaris victoriae (strain FI3) TaxID=930091 RepID=W7F792_BIPV3|nr:hypothetical protein COCVIDRAFT_33687 [Bipolaris victoriae FI3]
MEGKQNIDLASFNLKHHNDLLWSINYKYDYMPKYKPSLPFLIGLSSFPDLEAERISVESIINILPTPTEYPIKTSEALSINSLPISPTDAKPPWHSSIHHVRQNIHWQTVVEASKVLLYNISSDQNATTSKNRLKLLTEMNAYSFIFDCVWEMNDKVATEFVSRLKACVPDSEDESVSALQKAMRTTIKGLYDEDGIIGNGGAEVITTLQEFINHPPPPATFNSLREYLDYRTIDIAVSYTVACAKFSLNSTVDTTSPRFARFIRLYADHLSIANDLASFEREKRAYVKGKAHYLLNTVEEVRKMCSLDNDEAAKFATLAIQMEIEREMARELSRLDADRETSYAERELLSALVFLAGGNVMCSVIMSRYGGERSAV